MGLSLFEAVELANAAGAVKVTRFGTVPAMPRREEVRALRASLGLRPLV